MIDREHDLPVTRQAEILKISRGSVYYLPRPVSSADLEIMQRLDRLHLEYPFAGSRMLRGLLALQGCKIGRRHVKIGTIVVVLSATLVFIPIPLSNVVPALVIALISLISRRMPSTAICPSRFACNDFRS